VLKNHHKSQPRCQNLQAAAAGVGVVGVGGLGAKESTKRALQACTW
jgi:hypothetical protein